MPIVPDSKNWTWVLEQPCLECGFDSTSTELAEVPDLARANAAHWPAVLARAAVAQRPDESTWADLEYAAHVRDVYRIMAERLTHILEQDTPQFGNWDQDATAVEEDYLGQEPERVGAEIAEAAEEFARVVEGAPQAADDRPGVRSDGSVFTFRSLALYAIHDTIHHAHDVRAS